MVLIERHLVDVAEDAPVDEVTDEAGESGNPIALYLIKCHVDVL